MLKTLKGCTVLLGVAAFAGVAMADGLSAQRISIDDFARVESTTPQAIPVSERASVICWNNGPQDNVTAHWAQQTSIGFFQVADDFFVKHGFFKYVDTITVRFLISTSIDGVMFKPNMALNLYTDCNGRPDLLAGSISDPEKISATNLGPSVIAGFNKWEITFEVKQFLAGYGRWWIAPYGIGGIQDGLYYWCSANNGQIQGAQTQIKNGAEPWMDVEVCDCPGICTDSYFVITGHKCCLLKNNTPFATDGGGKSLQLKGAIVDTSRAADNFQVGPHGDVELCRVEAWMATNCPPEKVFLEIYANDCNMPGAKLMTIDIPDFPLYSDTGLTFNGCVIYHLVWPEIDSIVLAPGRDYWLSVVARGTGSILDKAFWMYKSNSALCHLNITEGKVKDVFVEGLEEFTFVSEATLGPPRDFAFQLYTNDIGARSDANSDEGGTSTPSEGTSLQAAPVSGSQSFSQQLTR